MSIFKESYNKQFKDFVCVDEMGNLRKPDYVSHKFKEILKKNDLRKIRFHDLRHSCATLLLKKGISFVFDKIKVVQKIGLFQLKNGPLFK